MYELTDNHYWRFTRLLEALLKDISLYGSNPISQALNPRVDGIDNGTFFGEWKPQVADNNVLLLNSEEISDTKLLGAMAAHLVTFTAEANPYGSGEAYLSPELNEE